MSMGVYIEGMEMPKTCELCPLVIRTVAFHLVSIKCKVTKKLRPDSCLTRPDSCPLIEVPPHGRLGDLDKLEKMFADIDSAPYSCFDGAEPFYSAEDAAHIIRLAPTIIPATAAKEGE